MVLEPKIIDRLCTGGRSLELFKVDITLMEASTPFDLE